MCEWCPNLKTGFADAVSGTWTMKYNAKTSLDPFPAIKAALVRKGVTTVFVNCNEVTMADWTSLSAD